MNTKLGIVGGGQLGRMLTISAKQMGFHVTVIDPTKNSPAGQIADVQIIADYDNSEATKKLAATTDFITIEVEHINAKTLQELADRGHTINPSPETIQTIKDKYAQKMYLQKHKVPTAECKEVVSTADIENAAKDWGFPILLKSKYNAFDGRGNVLIKSKKNIPDAFTRLAQSHRPELISGSLYVEKFVKFKIEIAVIVARDVKNNIVHYPIVETIHKNNICHIVKAPANISQKTRKAATSLAENVMKHLMGAGVFAIEMFVTKEGNVLVNEIAPRVHNSGHLTIEANETSQFEQHIRAVSGLTLGNTKMNVKAAVMINILGERNGPAELKGLKKVLAMENTHVHIYGKNETKTERKMGHITVTGKTVKEAYNKAIKARRLLTI